MNIHKYQYIIILYTREIATFTKWNIYTIYIQKRICVEIHIGAKQISQSCSRNVSHKASQHRSENAKRHHLKVARVLCFLEGVANKMCENKCGTLEKTFATGSQLYSIISEISFWKKNRRNQLTQIVSTLTVGSWFE